jgi:hypothetical protein
MAEAYPGFNFRIRELPLWETKHHEGMELVTETPETIFYKMMDGLCLLVHHITFCFS